MSNMYVIVVPFVFSLHADPENVKCNQLLEPIMKCADILFLEVCMLSTYHYLYLLWGVYMRFYILAYGGENSKSKMLTKPLISFFD